MTLNGRRLGIKAVSPDARVYDVKGIKTLPTKTGIGIKIEAHIKARPQRTPFETP